MQVPLLLYLKSSEVHNKIKGNLIIFTSNGQVPWQPSQKQFIICDDENWLDVRIKQHNYIKSPVIWTRRGGV